jgi:curved DNA-binding protein CbpA
MPGVLDDELNPYTVLQVDPRADQEAVRAAYRALARRYHPDVADPGGAHRHMVRLNRAWELVSEPARRRATDRDLAARGLLPRPARPDTREPGVAAPGGATPYQTPRWMQRNPTVQPVNPWAAGAAGPPPGRASGSILNFGVFKGWSLGEVSRHDPGYLIWLAERPEGLPYLAELQALRTHADQRAKPPGRPRGKRFFRSG